MYQFIIKELRKEKKVTLKQLSKQTGLSISYLSEIENNKIGEPSFKTICKICSVLQEDINDIYFINDDIESVRNILNIYTEKYGLTDNKTIKISKIMDSLVIENIELGKSKNIANIKQSTIDEKISVS